MALSFADSLMKWSKHPFDRQGGSLARTFQQRRGHLFSDDYKAGQQTTEDQQEAFDVLNLAAGQTSFRDRMFNLVKAGQMMKAVTSIRHALEKADLSDPRVHNKFKDLVSDLVSQLSDAQDKVLGEHLAKLIDLKLDANDPKLKSANHAVGFSPSGFNAA